jgi:hypothetical protein
MASLHHLEPRGPLRRSLGVRLTYRHILVEHFVLLSLLRRATLSQRGPTGPLKLSLLYEAKAYIWTNLCSTQILAATNDHWLVQEPEGLARSSVVVDRSVAPRPQGLTDRSSFPSAATLIATSHKLRYKRAGSAISHRTSSQDARGPSARVRSGAPGRPRLPGSGSA